MFLPVRNVLKFRASVSSLRQSTLAATAGNSPAAKWDLRAAVCIERPPYVTPPLSDIEQKTVNLLQLKEFEESMLNDHELKHKKDLERQERKAKGGDDFEEEAAVITAMDMEDSWKKSAEGFDPASKLSDADNNKDMKSVRREMDKPLRLLTKYKLGKDIFWDLPHGKHQDGETLRDTADRVVLQSIGEHCQVEILGNAPWSFYKVKYPKHYQQSSGSCGCKVWIYKGILMNHFHDIAQVKLDKDILDYQWVTRTEMEENLDKRIYRAVDSMLHDED